MCDVIFLEQPLYSTSSMQLMSGRSLCQILLVGVFASRFCTAFDAELECRSSCEGLEESRKVCVSNAFAGLFWLRCFALLPLSQVWGSGSSAVHPFKCFKCGWCRHFEGLCSHSLCEHYAWIDLACFTYASIQSMCSNSSISWSHIRGRQWWTWKECRSAGWSATSHAPWHEISSDLSCTFVMCTYVFLIASLSAQRNFLVHHGPSTKSHMRALAPPRTQGSLFITYDQTLISRGCRLGHWGLFQGPWVNSLQCSSGQECSQASTLAPGLVSSQVGGHRLFTFWGWNTQGLWMKWMQGAFASRLKQRTPNLTPGKLPFPALKVQRTHTLRLMSMCLV